MTDELLARPIVPVANDDDAIETYRSLREYLLETGATPLVVHVIEKAGGGIDKAGVEQRELAAEEAFEAFEERAAADGIEVETRMLYGTDVAGTIIGTAREEDASAIVFTSRGGSRWLDLVSGGVRSSLVTGSDRPVVVLPRSSE